MNKMKIIRPVLPQSCRIICVSDIHAKLDGFMALLQKCGYDSENDLLFILCDILDQRNRSLLFRHCSERTGRACP